jgi:hypothetical protein
VKGVPRDVQTRRNAWQGRASGRRPVKKERGGTPGYYEPVPHDPRLPHRDGGLGRVVEDMPYPVDAGVVLGGEADTFAEEIAQLPLTDGQFAGHLLHSAGGAPRTGGQGAHGGPRERSAGAATPVAGAAEGDTPAAPRGSGPPG